MQSLITLANKLTVVVPLNCSTVIRSCQQMPLVVYRSNVCLPAIGVDAVGVATTASSVEIKVGAIPVWSRNIITGKPKDIAPVALDAR